MNEFEEKYEELRYKYERLRRENEQLKEENKRYYDRMSHAEIRVEKELEPMIASRKAAYDRWVTDPER